MSTVFLGSDLKLSVTINPIDSLAAAEFDTLKISVYCSPNKILLFDKGESPNNMLEIDENTYVLLIDTTLLGVGDIKVKIEAEIPDRDFVETNKRKEVTMVDTGITIIKTI